MLETYISNQMFTAMFYAFILVMCSTNIFRISYNVQIYIYENMHCRLW